MNQSSQIPLVAEGELLRGLTPAQRQALQADCTIQTYLEATEILRQDEPATGCSVILRGRVEISHIDRQGNAVIVHVAGPGEVVGEVEIFSHRPCVATCTAMTNTTVLFCTAEALLRHIPAPLLVENFSNILHDRLHRDIRLRSIGQFYSAEQRICLYLEQFTTPEYPETRLSQAYLASLASCSRQTVNRKLGELRKLGIIEVKRGTIRVLDRARLTIDV
ncbi:MAG: Crp/Fnr family transcriptional regulator [Pararhodobacter sp.]